MAAAPSTFILATGGYDTAVRFFDATSQSLVRTIQFAGQHIIRLAFSGEGAVPADAPLYIAVAGSPTVCVYDVSTPDSSPVVYAPYKGHSEAVTAVGFEPRSAFVYSASEDGTLQTWLPEYTGVQGVHVGGGGPVPDAGHTGEEEGDSRLPEGVPGVLGAYQHAGRPFEPVRFVNDDHAGLIAIHDATYYPPDDLFFSVDAVGRLRVWDHHQQCLRAEVVPHHSRRNLQCLDLSSDYTLLALANFDGLVFVYHVDELLADPDNVRPVSFRADSSYITRVLFSASTNLLVCTTRSGLTKVFRKSDFLCGGGAATGSSEQTGGDSVAPAMEFPGQPGWVWDAAFVGDVEDYLFTCSSNTQVMLWALGNMRHSTEYSGHEKAVVCLAVKERSYAFAASDIPDLAGIDEYGMTGLTQYDSMGEISALNGDATSQPSSAVGDTEVGA